MGAEVDSGLISTTDAVTSIELSWTEGEVVVKDEGATVVVFTDGESALVDTLGSNTHPSGVVIGTQSRFSERIISLCYSIRKLVIAVELIFMQINRK